MERGTGTEGLPEFGRLNNGRNHLELLNLIYEILLMRANPNTMFLNYTNNANHINAFSLTI